MLSIEGTNNRHCATCDRTLIDTDGMTDESLEELLRHDSHACLIVSTSQENLMIL
ncbi:MAG: hypothetical protein QM758_12305 [Armatimonas sp.]